jgi:hypothetical protein
MGAAMNLFPYIWAKSREGLESMIEDSLAFGDLCWAEYERGTIRRVGRGWGLFLDD